MPHDCWAISCSTVTAACRWPKSHASCTSVAQRLHASRACRPSRSSSRPSGAEPPDVLRVFRSRQHHEQAYRVGVYDEGLDAVPCAYDKHSPDPKRPRFHRGPLQMLGWLLALVYNAVADLSASLPEKWAGAEIRKLRRAWFNRPDTGGVDCVPGSVYGSAHVGPSGRRFQPGVSSYSLVGGPSASHILKLSWPCRPRSVVSH
jgi:hypothetical protein